MKPKFFITSGAIFPAIVITAIGVGVVTVLTFIISNAMKNHGLMPTPSPLWRYRCEGFAIASTFHFRHGKDVVEWHAAQLSMRGEIINGHIIWAAPASASANDLSQVPTELIYDDTQKVLTRDAQGVVQSCQRLP